MPAPKHKPNAIPKPTLSVAFPIMIPASNPIPAPKDILDSFIVIVELVFSLVKNYIDSGSKEYLVGTKLCSLNIC